MNEPSFREPAFWQQRYEEGRTGWDHGAPAPPLVRGVRQLALAPGSRALVPGCGYGHEALFLAREGFQVTAVDFAPRALEVLRQQAAGLSLEAVERDLFTLDRDYGDTFDLVVEHTCFCAIPVERRDEYARVMGRVLKEGAVLLGLFWEFADEDGPPFPCTRVDLERHFGGRFAIEATDRAADSFADRGGIEWLARLRRL